MFIATVIVTIVLAVTLGFSAFRTVTRDRAMVDNIYGVGIRDEWMPILAGILATCAVGLVGGLIWWPLGVAAAGISVLYFLTAIGAHLRVRDRQVVPALAFLVIAAAVLALRLVTRG